MYLHKNGDDCTVEYDNKDVARLFDPEVEERLKFTKKTHVWPDSHDTNLMVSRVNYNHMGRLKGHAERLVLERLPAMLEYFLVNHQCSPSHVVLVSRLAPCHKAEDPSRPVEGCTQEIIREFSKCKRQFPETVFVLGYNKVDEKHVEQWQEAERLLAGEKTMKLVKIPS